MIYLFDEPLAENSHSKYIIDILKNHTSTDIKIIPILKETTIKTIFNTLTELIDIVGYNDIVLCPWCIEGNIYIDELFYELAELCWVVCAAGNFNKPIEKYTPARVENVITVATLNKSGIKAVLSNYSETKELIWIPGTNYNVGWKNSSGSSVSAAIYAAFLAESINANDFNLLDKLILEHKERVFKELNI